MAPSTPLSPGQIFAILGLCVFTLLIGWLVYSIYIGLLVQRVLLANRRLADISFSERVMLGVGGGGGKVYSAGGEGEEGRGTQYGIGMVGEGEGRAENVGMESVWYGRTEGREDLACGGGCGDCGYHAEVGSLEGYGGSLGAGSERWKLARV